MKLTDLENGIPTFYTALLQTRSNRVLREHVNESIAEFKITVTEWIILALVNHHKKLKLVELADHLDVEAPLITNLIDLLKTKNLLKKEASTSDKRAKYIVLTTQGKRLTPRIEKKVEEKMNLLLRGITDKELTAYFKVLQRIAFP